MSELIVYATFEDARIIHSWINADPDIAWIVKVGQSGITYRWQAVSELPMLLEQEYALWHIKSDQLNIPSGSAKIPDAIVADPFHGWSQTLEYTNASAPWFGGNLPGPFSFHFRASSREDAALLGRSGFYWAADRFKSVGKGAHPEAARWWSRLKRFLAKNSTTIPWLGVASTDRTIAYVFPDAMAQIQSGRRRDINP